MSCPLWSCPRLLSGQRHNQARLVLEERRRCTAVAYPGPAAAIAGERHSLVEVDHEEADREEADCTAGLMGLGCTLGEYRIPEEPRMELGIVPGEGLRKVLRKVLGRADPVEADCTLGFVGDTVPAEADYTLEAAVLVGGTGHHEEADAAGSVRREAADKAAGPPAEPVQGEPDTPGFVHSSAGSAAGTTAVDRRAAGHTEPARAVPELPDSTERRPDRKAEAAPPDSPVGHLRPEDWPVRSRAAAGSWSPV